MPGALYEYLSSDHRRLDLLLQQAAGKAGTIDMQGYAEFRKGLLRHVAMEEKIVLPCIARAQGGRPASMAGRIRLDHGALVALLVPPPSLTIVATLRSILKVHNVLEEKEGGMYKLFEQYAGAETERLLKDLHSSPEVPVVPHNARPGVLDATRRAVARAGYEFKDGAA